MGNGCKSKNSVYQTNTEPLSDSDESTTTSFSNIKSLYILDKQILGFGQYGIVRLASLISNPHKKFAVKSIQKNKMSDDLHLLRRELEILKGLDHPNIVRFYETYQDQKYIHFVQEYCSGGELLERVVQKGRFDEVEASRIMHKILQAVSYLHLLGICHRDLKLENFLFSDESTDSEIKIIDFGLSKHVSQIDKKDNRMTKGLRTSVGTPIYIAPEVLTGHYGLMADYWSLGVIIYILLTGLPPFSGENKALIFHNILNSQVQFQTEESKHISKEGQDLIKKLLNKNPLKRITAQDALNHSWFNIAKKKHEHNQQKNMLNVSPNILNNLQKFQRTTKFKKEILKITLNFLSDSELRELQQAFRMIDKENQGYINDQDMLQLLQKKGYKQAVKEVNRVFLNLGIKNKQINYSQFLAATLDSQFFMKRENVWNIFKFLDTDNTDSISIHNIQEILARNGRQVKEEELHKMLKEFDINNDGKVCFEEFCAIIEWEHADHPETKKILYQNIIRIKNQSNVLH